MSEHSENYRAKLVYVCVCVCVCGSRELIKTCGNTHHYMLPIMRTTADNYWPSGIRKNVRESDKTFRIVDQE